MMYEYGEPLCNDADRRKSKNSEENVFQCHFVDHKSHIDLAGCEHGLCGERLTAGLSHDTDKLIFSQLVEKCSAFT
jgi:hypothetical protein